MRNNNKQTTTAAMAFQETWLRTKRLEQEANKGINVETVGFENAKNMLQDNPRHGRVILTLQNSRKKSIYEKLLN